MGKRGPKPKTEKDLARSDSWRGKTRGAGPSVTPGPPGQPSWLDDDEQALWDTLSAELVSMGIAAKEDGVMLGMLVQKLAVYLEAHAERKRTGMVLYGEKGGAYQNPVMGCERTAWQDVVKVCKEFGLSPASRGSVSALQAEEEKGGFFDKGL